MKKVSSPMQLSERAFDPELLRRVQGSGYPWMDGLPEGLPVSESGPITPPPTPEG